MLVRLDHTCEHLVGRSISLSDNGLLNREVSMLITRGVEDCQDRRRVVADANVSAPFCRLGKGIARRGLAVF